VLCLTAAAYAPAQQFDFPEAAVSDPSALSNAMPALAKQVLATYKDEERGVYLDNLFRLQIVAGQYKDALGSLGLLRELLRANHPARAAWVNFQYEIYARAKAKQNADNQPWEEAYKQSFRDLVGPMDDRASALLIRALRGANQFLMKRDLEDDLVRQKDKNAVSLVDALKLIRDYQVEEAYRSFTPLIGTLIAEDDARRYLIEKDIQVKTPDDATICTLVVRSRAASGRLPSLLLFTIYADDNDNLTEARRTASNGYAGVIGLTRGKGCSRGRPVPYEHDGSDAAALIGLVPNRGVTEGLACTAGATRDSRHGLQSSMDRKA
jgi:hypothetical protein